ncbi:MAG: TatD family hydrolase [Kiritimatiellae bacterium]|nr:TatD family hydrolase [Kiritimatiellia bacterium]
MFDAHAHLHAKEISGTLERILVDAAAAGVTGICSCGTCPEDWAATQMLSLRPLPMVLVPGFGVHPWYAEPLPDAWLESLEGCLDANPVAAVGEIGLDGVRDAVSAEVQEKVFVAQLELASRLSRPVILHGARAWGRLVAVLRPFASRLPGFVAHGFGGSREILTNIVAMGGYVSFAGSVCNHKAVKIRAAARETPECQILVETDTPDLFPRGGKSAGAGTGGKPLNQPCNLSLVLSEVATLRGMDPDTLADLTGANARRVLL